MTTRDIFTPEEVAKKFQSLPEDIRSAIYGSDMTAALKTIADKHRLHLDQLSNLEAETSFVMLGFTEPKDFVRVLMERVPVSKEGAETIAQEVDAAIFQKIRESLKKMHAQETPVATPPPGSLAAKVPLPQRPSTSPGVPAPASAPGPTPSFPNEQRSVPLKPAASNEQGSTLLKYPASPSGGVVAPVNIPAPTSKPSANIQTPSPASPPITKNATSQQGSTLLARSNLAQGPVFSPTPITQNGIPTSRRETPPAIHRPSANPTSPSQLVAVAGKVPTPGQPFVHAEDAFSRPIIQKEKVLDVGIAPAKNIGSGTPAPRKIDPYREPIE